MASWTHLARQALLAALVVLPVTAFADVFARYHENGGVVRVLGLAPDDIAAALEEPDRVRLQIEGAASARGMLVALSEQSGALQIRPRFALRSGSEYDLKLDLPRGAFKTRIDVAASMANTPELTSFVPSQAVIPANTLRVYLQFSEPMARGQLLGAVKLLRQDGTLIDSPFLALEAELWDPTQSRATLLFDPGRIKQGVGPNERAGAPLQPGGSYWLVVSGSMKSAKGVPLGDDAIVAFRAGAAQRDAIATEAWQILAPESGTLAPLSVAFDRIIDGAAAVRRLSLHDPTGNQVPGAVSADGGGWTLAPNAPWAAGTFTLRIAADLEDVSGNTVAHPFDAAPGTIGTGHPPVEISIEIPSPQRQGDRDQ